MQLAQAYDTQFAEISSEEERQVAERYLRPYKSKELVFEFTRDVGYLHQYYMLRDRERFNIWGKSLPAVQEDEMDRQSHILITRRDNQVMAGGRLTISSPRRPLLLPMEQGDFRLQQAFPELNLEHHKYAEVSCVVIEDEFLNEDSLRTVFQHLYRKIVATRVEFVFGLATVSITKDYQKIAQSAGLDLHIRSFGEVDGVQTNLIMTPITLLAEMLHEESSVDVQRETVSIW
jgi:hypothetical protein